MPPRNMRPATIQRTRENIPSLPPRSVPAWPLNQETIALWLHGLLKNEPVIASRRRSNPGPLPCRCPGLLRRRAPRNDDELPIRNTSARFFEVGSNSDLSLSAPGGGEAR